MKSRAWSIFGILLSVGVLASWCPLSATEITRELVVDLDADGRVIAFPDGDAWEGQVSIGDLSITQGDQLNLRIRFANNKALQLTQLGIQDQLEQGKLTLIPQDATTPVPTIVNWQVLFDLDYVGVSEGFISGGSTSNLVGGGQVFTAGEQRNLTDNSFSYTGVNIFVDFLTYNLQQGTGVFDRIEWSAAADDVSVIDSILQVIIDVQPGSEKNSINLSASGVVPVAILSSADFDATTVDPTTVSLAGASVKMVGKSDKYLCNQEDVSNDGLVDLVCQVYTAQFMIEEGETSALLEARTLDGLKLRGEDTIRIVPDN